MIYVIAEIELNAGSRDQFMAHLQANIPNVRAEEGCIEYVATVDVQADLAAQPALRADTVTVVEKWESLEALKVHLAAPHMVTFRENVKGLVAKTELRVLDPA